jgi:hypothetical protein
MIKYIATAHYADADISCESHSLDTIMDFLSEHEETHQDVINAHTGEVLYIGNSPTGEDYIEDEFLNTTVEWMLTAPGGAQPQADPREEIIRDIMEVCEEFGATFSMIL